MFWACRRQKNFGDLLGPYIFYNRTGLKPTFIESRNRYAGKLLFTVGSILHHIKRRDQAVVWGSGIMDRNYRFCRPSRVVAVRGPYTGQRLKDLDYPTSAVYGDPGVLLPRFFAPRTSENFALGIIPHRVDLPHLGEPFVSKEVKIIDVTAPIEEVVQNIQQCRYIVSSSLHGLIVANAYGKRAGWFRMSDRLKGDDVKFLDYYHGIQPTLDVPEFMLSPQTISEAIRRTSGLPVLDISDCQERLLRSCPF